jgi:putative DNA primase/helicase
MQEKPLTINATDIQPSHMPSGLLRLPRALRDEKRWMVWSITENGDKKIPVSPVTGGFADCSDSETWCDYDTAALYLVSNGLSSLGFALTDLPGFTPITIVDFDHVSPAGEVPPEWALEIMDGLDSYTERSCSGTGFHTFVLGSVANNVSGAKMPGGHGGTQKVEVFSKDKMFAVSGDALPGFEEIRQGHQGILQAVCTKASKGAFIHSSGELIVKANGLTLEQLEHGEDGGDASNADYQYVAVLAEKGLTDEEIDARFRDSGRWRDKWDRNAGQGMTYGERTIKRVRAKQAAAAPVDAFVNVDPDDWPKLFHTYEETMHAPPLKFAIKGFLQEDGITFVGGPAGHGKTLVMLNMAKVLLEGGALFNYEHFPVVSTSKRVLYLIPESGLGPFVYRLGIFALREHVRAGKLFYRTMTAKEPWGKLTDKRLLKAAEGADVFLDTAIRFMEGEENSATDSRQFADVLFALQAAGARTITCAHHSPKGFENKDTMSLENALRGSGDIGAMAAAAWGLRQIDKAANRVHIENLKCRDFEPCMPFQLEGRPWIDQEHSFKMTTKPGMVAVKTKPVQTEDPKIVAARALKGEGYTDADVAEKLGLTDRTLRNWRAGGKL